MDENVEKYSFESDEEAQNLLNNSRKRIDEIDNKLFELICQRTSLAPGIALSKNYLGISVFDKSREEVIYDKIERLAKDNNIDSDIVNQIMNMLITLSKDEQEKILKEANNGKY